VTTSRLLAAMALATLALFVGPSTGFAASTKSPTVVLAQPSGSPGDLVDATLEHWPTGLVTVSVCGNEARRGSQDCDLRSAFSVNMPAGGDMRIRVSLVRPPGSCPCVVRAATTTNATVRLAPIVLNGVPAGAAPPPAAVSVAADGLAVHARVLDGTSSWTSVFGAATSRTLRLTIDNRGVSDTPPLRIIGGVGRDATSGEGFASRLIPPLAGGEHRTVTIPVEMSVPAFGDYVVFGTIYGLDAPVTFRADTDNDPWALELAIPVLLLVGAQLARRRERCRAAREPASLPVLEVPRAEPTEIVLDPLPECSPDVGDRDEERYPTPSYDSRDRETTPAATVAGTLV
jgi:hypothetical protein